MQNSMKQKLLTIGVSALFCVPAFAENNENSDYDKYLKTPEIRAAELWKESWQVGKEYQHLADFEINAKVKARPKQDATWWMKMWGKAAEDTVGHLRVGGNSSAFTGVGCKQKNGEMLLVRNFLDTDLQTNYYIDPKENLAANFVMKTVMTKGELDKLITKSTAEIVATVAAVKAYTAAVAATVGTGGTAAAPTIAAASAAYAAAKKATEAIMESFDVGGKIEDVVRGQLLDAGLSEEEKDGETVYLVKNRSRASKYFGDIANKADFAVKLAESFRCRDYLIFAGTDGVISAKQISSKTVRDIEALREKGALAQNFEALRNLDGKPAKDAESVFKRESLGLNAKIFGNRERKLGDVWVADADFLNSFLHPDLGGKFKGRVLLKYDSDTRLRDYWDTPFVARKLVMLQHNGKDSTSAEYDEKDFSLSLNGARTSLEIFLDAETLVVREVRIHAESDVRSGNLPDTIFTRGLELRGGLECSMRYHCRETSLELDK